MQGEAASPPAANHSRLCSQGLMKRTVRVRADLWPAIVAGSFHLSFNSRYALAEAPIMLARMRKNEPLGKIVLSV